MAKHRKLSRAPAQRKSPPKPGPAAASVIKATNEKMSLKRELLGARREQAATADILKAISGSTNDLKPVLDAIAETAARLCGARFAFVYRLDADKFHLAASSNANAAWVQYVRDQPIAPGRATVVGRTLLERRTIHVEDVLADREYTDTQRQRLGKYRTVLGVPLLRSQTPIGAIILVRRTVRPFSIAQITLVETFADQAVIAIENVRLFDETKEALARQTATSDILRIISQSPTDVQPIFDAIVLASVRLLECDRSVFVRCDSTSFWQVALAGSMGLLKIVDSGKHPIDPDAHFPSRAIVGKKTLHLPDWSLIDLPAFERRIHETYGITSALYLPLVREGECIGVLALAGKRAGMFGESEITLAESFRDQALIAIENTRLFNEVKERTEDLSESLQQQTATADVLKVISRSTFDLQTVLDTLVESATRLCEADHALLFQRYGEFLRFAASFGFGTDVHLQVREMFLGREMPIDRGSITGRSALEARVLHVTDVLTDPEYTWNEAQRIEGHRAALGAPLLDRLIQTEKLASLGQLTAGIAHEIKNPLNFVNNFSALTVELTDELNDLLKPAPLDNKMREEAN